MQPDMNATMVVDPEHIGIRTLMPILALSGLIGGWILGIVVARAIDESLGSLCISAVLAGIGLLVMTQVGERIIKPVWSSGRYLEVNPVELKLIDQRRSWQGEEKQIVWGQDITAQAWYFVVLTRKSRVPKGWFCTSIRLAQNNQEMILYTFMSPDTAQNMEHWVDWFIELHGKKEREQMAQVDPRWAAQQERYRRLEGQRYFDGAELITEDFLRVMELVSKHARLMK